MLRDAGANKDVNGNMVANSMQDIDMVDNPPYKDEMDQYLGPNYWEGNKQNLKFMIAKLHR